MVLLLLLLDSQSSKTDGHEVGTVYRGNNQKPPGNGDDVASTHDPGTLGLVTQMCSLSVKDTLPFLVRVGVLRSALGKSATDHISTLLLLCQGQLLQRLSFLSSHNSILLSFEMCLLAGVGGETLWHMHDSITWKNWMAGGPHSLPPECKSMCLPCAPCLQKY